MSSNISSQSVTKRPINTGLVVTALVVLTLILCVPTFNMGLWIDELYSVHSATVPDLPTLIATMYGRLDDLHPPLSYVLLFTSMHLFGTNDFSVRLPPLLCGLALIPAMYWLGKTVHSRSVGLLAAYFAAVSPFANYFACQSRGYALSTLLTALSLTFFCKLVNVETTKAKSVFVGFVLTAMALCYTEYVGCVLLPALGVAAVLICLRDYGHSTSKSQALSMFLRCLCALALAFLLFAPWIPSVLKQAHCAHDPMGSIPLSYWPKVFFFNLLMMLPVPLVLGIVLGVLAPIVLTVYAIGKRRELFDQVRLKMVVVHMPAAYIVLLCTVLVPSSVIGYITTWWIGYFRYIFPFSPAGWVLLAMALDKLFRHWETPHRPESPASSTNTVRVGNIKRNLFLILMFLVNAAYLCWFDSRPQSGLRTVAAEALKGEFDNCAIILAPDVIGPTLGYYVPVSARRAHHILICGFPRWDDPFTPVAIPDLPTQWGPPEIVEQAEKRIDELSKSGYKYLVFAKDSDKQIDALTSRETPRGPRIRALQKILDQKYKKMSVKHYAGVTEDVTVSVYQLVNPSHS